MPITLDGLQRFAVARSLFPPTTLKRALHRLGFVQADPIRTPARAQDLTLRHRAKGYCAGDLERRYVELVGLLVLHDPRHLVAERFAVSGAPQLVLRPPAE